MPAIRTWRSAWMNGAAAAKMCAILVAKELTMVQKSARNGDLHEIGGESVNTMKTIKFLAMVAFAAAALSGLNACAAKATTTSSGTSATMTTEHSK